MRHNLSGRKGNVFKNEQIHSGYLQICSAILYEPFILGDKPSKDGD